jgi:hypothetical protein
MESSALVFSDDQHRTPVRTCPPGAGPINVDGRCILGGVLLAAGLRGQSLPSMGFPAVGCSAFPVYTQDMVPYTNGTVAGDNYTLLSSLKEGTKLLRMPF